MFYGWLIIVIVLSLIEIFTTDLVCIWFIISGIIAMISSLFITKFLIQLSIFVLIGVILLIFTKKIINNLNISKEKANVDRVIGMTGKVIKTIDKDVPGEVKVDGKIWQAIADEELKYNDLVTVMEINSTKLKVIKKGEEK